MVIKDIKSDLFRYKLTGMKGFIRGLFIPGFKYMMFYRLASHYRNNMILGLLFKVILRWYTFRFGFQIPLGAQIGEGFYIGHFGTIVINERAVIGKNCNIAHLVTIGQASRGKREGVPTISDYVWIGTGAVIVGKVTIGTRVLIAPNAFVNIDVPPNSIVIGNPCKIIPADDPCLGYIIDVLNP